MNPPSNVQTRAEESAQFAQEETTDEASGYCPQCGTANPEGAQFCGECGHALQARQCPQCGNALTPTADFCESCRTWLLQGQCRFCYAGLPEGSAFCPDCGNPQTGITCPGCGTHNFFDFCTACAAPLTEGAQQALAVTAQDPLAQAALRQMAELATVQAQLTELPPATSSSPAPRPRHGLFSERGKQALARMQEEVREREQQVLNDATQALARQNAELARLAAENRLRQDDADQQQAQAAQALMNAVQLRRSQALADLKALIQHYSAKNFANHQEARRFFMALQQQFPAVFTGWRCNCCGVLHPNPNICGDPSQGGHWVIDEQAINGA